MRIGLKSNSHAPKIMRVNILRTHVFFAHGGGGGGGGVRPWGMRRQIHTGVYLHMGKFTPGSDQMQIFFLQIHTCKFTIMSYANAK